MHCGKKASDGISAGVVFTTHQIMLQLSSSAMITCVGACMRLYTLGNGGGGGGGVEGGGRVGREGRGKYLTPAVALLMCVSVVVDNFPRVDALALPVQLVVGSISGGVQI